jgi:hypothetical protein
MGLPRTTFRHLLLDQVLSLVLSQSGHFVLHASAVHSNEFGTVAFVGHAGSGKSTLGGALGIRGCSVASDDCLVVADVGGTPMVVPGYPGLRLWRDSLAPYVYLMDVEDRDQLSRMFSQLATLATLVRIPPPARHRRPRRAVADGGPSARSDTGVNDDKSESRPDEFRGDGDCRGCHPRIGMDLRKVVGAEGFEPPTLWSQTRCATRLRYAPTCTAEATDDKGGRLPPPDIGGLPRLSHGPTGSCTYTSRQRTERPQMLRLLIAGGLAAFVGTNTPQEPANLNKSAEKCRIAATALRTRNTGPGVAMEAVTACSVDRTAQKNHLHHALQGHPWHTDDEHLD